VRQARPHGPNFQSAEFFLGARAREAGALVQEQGVRLVRRSDPAHRRVGDRLRHRSGPSVRANGRVLLGVVAGDRRFARQAALDANSESPSHRHAEDGRRSPPRRRLAGDRADGWSAHRHQAARGHARDRRHPRRQHPRRSGHRRDPPGAGRQERPSPAIRRGEPRPRHPRVRDRRKRRRGHATRGARRRVSQQRAPRRPRRARRSWGSASRASTCSRARTDRSSPR